MIVIYGRVVIGRFDNWVIMLFGKLLQCIQIGKLVFAHGFKINVELSVILHEIDTIHTIGTDTRKIIFRSS